MITSLFADYIQQMKFHHAGYTFKSTQYPLLLLLFADDAVLVANSPEKCQELLNQTDNFLDWAKIKAKVVKCRSLAFRKRPTNCFFNPNLNISGQSIPYIGDQDIRFLGLPIDLSLSAHKLKQDLLGRLHAIVFAKCGQTAIESKTKAEDVQNGHMSKDLVVFVYKGNSSDMDRTYS